MIDGHTNPVEAVKRAALEAVEASKPVNIVFGTVSSVNPLRVNVEQKITLGTKQLILARNVTDYSVSAVMENCEVRTLHVHNALRIDEPLILLRMQKGKKYLVLDRLEV